MDDATLDAIEARHLRAMRQMNRLLDAHGPTHQEATLARSMYDVPALVAEVRRLRDKVERATTVRNGWRNNHDPDECGCAWCDIWEDLDDALDRDHAAPTERK